MSAHVAQEDVAKMPEMYFNANKSYPLPTDCGRPSSSAQLDKGWCSDECERAWRAAHPPPVPTPAAYLPLARSIVRKMEWQWEGLLDLNEALSIAFAALVDAAASHDPARGPYPAWAGVKITSRLRDAARARRRQRKIAPIDPWCTFAPDFERRTLRRLRGADDEEGRTLARIAVGQVLARLEALDPRLRFVVEQRFLLDRDDTEIAAALRVSTTYVVRLRKWAREAVQAHYAPALCGVRNG